MAQPVSISLMPTDFGSIVQNYIRKWDEHIDWVKQTLDQIIDLDTKNDMMKTPLAKKSTLGKKRSTNARSTMMKSSRPSANILNSVMVNKTGRMTRSTTRLLKEHKMINEDGNIIQVNEDVIKALDTKFEENRDSKVDDEINNRDSKVKKVSFPTLKDDVNTNENKAETDKLSTDEATKKNSIKKTSTEIDASDKKADDKLINSKTIEVNDEATIVPADAKQNDDQINQQVTEQVADDKMEFSPVKPAKAIEKKSTTPNKPNKSPQFSSKEDEEWLTDDESSVKLSDKLSKVINVESANSKLKDVRTPINKPRSGLKRSATAKSATKTAEKLDVKRNKTNAHLTPQVFKKSGLNSGSKPLSASKPPFRPPLVTATQIKSTATKIATAPHSSNIKKPEIRLEAPSHQTKVNSNFLHPYSNAKAASAFTTPATKNHLPHPTQSASSSISSQASLKSASLQSSNSKTSPERNKSKFADSDLKKALHSKNVHTTTTDFKSKIGQATTVTAKLKKDEYFQKISQETKSKREERQRKVNENRLLQEAEKRRQEELKKQALKQQAEQEARKQAEELRIKEQLRKKEEEEEKLRQQKLLQEQQQKEKQAKKVQINVDEEDKETKFFSTLEKEIRKDEMKCKNTPLKQLRENALNKTNAEKSLHNNATTEIDPSLDVINLSLDTSDSSISIDEDTQYMKEKASNCTFIKDIKNQALSSTMIKPVEPNKTILVEKSPSPPPEPLDTYDISDLCSDDDDYEQRVITKKTPLWSKGTEFVTAIKAQFSVGSRARENQIKKLFSSIESNVSLEKVFSESKNYVTSKYQRRTSSACWSSPPATYIDSSFSKFY